MKPLILALLIPAAAAGVEGPPAEYLQAIERYRAGDRDAASEAWLEQRGREAVAGLKRLRQAGSRCGDCEERRLFESFPFEAAAMLHTDRDVEERGWPSGEEGVPPMPAPHLDLALQVIELIPDPGRRRRFEPRWALAVVLHLFQFGQWALALRYGERVLERYPGDPLLLLARGSLLEALNVLDSEPVTSQDLAANTPSRRDAVRERASGNRARLHAAQDCYRRALLADPGLHEARLRVGRVWHRLGEPGKAVPELDAVAASPDAADGIRYLARLFLGGALEAEGRLPAAIRAYRAAIDVRPDGQAAHVALSHALHSGGDRAESRQELRTAVADANGHRQADPWWGYLWGRSEEAEGRLGDLRRQVVR